MLCQVQIRLFGIPDTRTVGEKCLQNTGKQHQTGNKEEGRSVSQKMKVEHGSMQPQKGIEDIGNGRLIKGEERKMIIL